MQDLTKFIMNIYLSLMNSSLSLVCCSVLLLLDDLPFYIMVIRYRRAI